MTRTLWRALGIPVLAGPVFAMSPAHAEPVLVGELQQVDEPASEPEPRATTYTIQPESSTLLVAIRNDTSAWASRLGHDHAIVASDFTGKVVWPHGDASACNIYFSVPVQALVVDPEGARERMGFEGTTSESDKNTITKNFRGASQLNMEEHPTISFQSTSCSQLSGEVVVKGNFTLRGVSKPVVATMTVSADSSSFHATGGFEANHTDFGFKPYQALGGSLRNQDRLQFVLDVKGSAR